MPSVALTRFYIEADGVIIEGEGVVTVTGAPDPNPGPTIAAFLSALDPAVVEQTALDRQEWGSGSLAKAIIEVLAEIAVGKPGT